MFVSGSETRIFKKGDKNTNITCYGSGYPAPNVTWTKGGKETILQVPDFSPNHSRRVVQVLSGDVTSALDNFTSRLYLHTAGITYNEAGNYSCTASNGVERPAKTGVEVLCKWYSEHEICKKTFDLCSVIILIGDFPGVARASLFKETAGSTQSKHTV